MRLGQLGIVLRRSAAAAPALRPRGRCRRGPPTSGSASAHPSACRPGRGRHARAPRRVWPAWCRRVTSLSSSAMAACAGIATAAQSDSQRGNAAARILNCIVEGGALGGCRAASISALGTGRYTESIVGYAHDAESPSRRDARRGERCEAGPPLHDTSHPQHADARDRELHADRAGPRPPLRLRHHDLRPLPHGPCALHAGLRRGAALAEDARLPRHLRAQHHRHRRQDHPARARARHLDPRAHRGE